MPDIELLSILRIMCDVIAEPHESQKLNSHTREVPNIPICRKNKAMWNETGRVSIHDCKINLPDYFRSITNKAEDKKASKVLTNKIHNEFS